MHIRLYLFFSLALIIGACSEESAPSTKTSQGRDTRRGRGIYLASCAACHNRDPSKAGPVGPEIAGSSKALLEAKILRASYPPGYTPKRKSTLMPAQPYLKSAIPHLAAFLDSTLASSETDQKK